MLIIIKRHQNHRARSSWRYSTITSDKYSSLVFLRRKSAERKEEEDIKEDTIERRGE